MESTWLDSYDEAVEFFYWEPQHIGRKKYAGTKTNRHVRRSSRASARDGGLWKRAPFNGSVM